VKPRPDWRAKQAALEAQKLAATRTVGWVMVVPGALLLGVAALMLFDFGAVPEGVDTCTAVISLPLLIGGARRLTAPEKYLADGHHDLDGA
jgi:hypothetical protein